MANDHYVPQFYLKNFRVTELSSKIQPQSIYLYKKGLNPIPRPIKGVACEFDFDKFSETELDDETYNKLLNISEDAAPAIVSEIINDSGFSISESNKEVISWFIALLTIRTPTAHQYFTNDILNFKNKILLPYIQKACISDKQEIYKILRIEQHDISDEEVEGIINLFLKKEFYMEFPMNDNNKAYLRGFGVANLDFLVNNLMSKNWHLIVTENDSFFITSDNPVCFLTPRILSVNNNVFYDCPIFLPLSPKKALYIHHYKFLKDIISLNEKQVNYFVNKTKRHANNCLFSNVKSDTIKKGFDAIQFNLSNLNYKYVFAPYFQLKYALKNSLYRSSWETRND